MARLKSHGGKVAEFERLTFRMAYCADGKILRNSGDGWKLWKKLKEGVTVEEAIEYKRKAVEEKRAKFPTWAKFFDAFTAYPLKIRWMIYSALELMPDDPDGVWAELTDHHWGEFTIEEICELCSLYKLACAELGLTEKVSSQV